AVQVCPYDGTLVLRYPWPRVSDPQSHTDFSFPLHAARTKSNNPVLSATFGTEVVGICQKIQNDRFEIHRKSLYGAARFQAGPNLDIGDICNSRKLSSDAVDKGVDVDVDTLTFVFSYSVKRKFSPSLHRLDMS